MYQILSIITIAASLYWLMSFLKKNELSFGGVVNKFWNDLKDSVAILKKRDFKSIHASLNFFRSFFYLSTLFLFLVMTFSAMIPVIIGINLSDLFLLIHVTAAPIFSLFIAITIILFAHSHRFSKDDLKENSNGEKVNITHNGFLKIIFWLFSLFTFTALSSIVLNMFPLFGTEGQVYLLDVHKYSTLLLLLLVIFHSGLITVSSNQNLK